MLFFKKDEEKKRIEKSFNAVMNNYKFKEIFLDKLEKEKSIQKMIGKKIKLNRFLSITEWITHTIILGKLAFYINSIKSPDISFHIMDYLIITCMVSGLFILTWSIFFIIKSLLPTVFSKQSNKNLNLFNFTNEELNELSLKINSDEMEDLLIYLENTHTEHTLSNLDFCESPLEIKMNKNKNRTALIENIYRGTENGK